MRDDAELNMGWLGRSIANSCHGGLFRVFGEVIQLAYSEFQDHNIYTPFSTIPIHNTNHPHNQT